ncbi:winged helix-turn-helix domain-containing protein [Acidisphaera sp. S103]|uniref:ATP-binding protein n=1 Tax=Acidisphaera sp. S103 TaxID=1747223 RepID=UPI00131E16D6|nr:winged helix-turn-helix domain-containing protein [Acidisphaera sp. S103]
MLAEAVRPVYASGECEIDLARRELRILGSPVPVGGRAFEIIEVLAESAGELVTKGELMDRIWPGAIVMENTLHVHTAAVRKALGRHRGLLKTVSGRGYRLLGDWSIRCRDTAVPPVGLQQIRISDETSGSNFPLTVTRLVGRSDAVQRIQDLVTAYRIVTLTGPGGIGKTSLAVTVARRVLGEFDNGGSLVELASLSDPALVPSTVAHALGLKLGGEVVSAETVARAVGGQNLLLVIDNCEHVIDAVATLAEMFVRLCPRTTILATSREILRIEGEHVYRVPPLDVPAADKKEPDHILNHSAVELFIARAKVLDADFSHTHDLPAISTICRHLDGIPLAIEFAAARAAALGIEQVAIGLHDRFALLTNGRRTAVPRHRTLRAALDWSYELLPEPERLLFRWLAVFPAGFTIHAAAAVMRESGLDASAVMGGVANLVTKSLVTLDQSEASTRWRLLETIRAYALEKLTDSAEANMAAGHHAGYFRDLFALPAPGTRSRLSNEDIGDRVREIDNVRAALDWSFAPAGDTAVGVHLTAAYAPVWLHLSLIGECRDRCERALLAWDGESGLSARLQMELQIALGNTLIVTLGSGEEIITILTSAFEIAKALNELDAQARVLASLSTAYIYYGEYGQAQTALEQLRQVAHELGDSGIVAVADQRIGTRLLMAGRHREAQRCFERILETPLPPEEQRPEFWNYIHARAMARALMARTLCLQGFPESAHREALMSVEEVQATDHPLSICRVLHFGPCRIASMTGDFVAAERAIAHLIEIAARLNALFWQVMGRFLEGKLMVERRDFAQGLTVLREAFDICGRTGWRVSYPEFRGALAAAHLGLGQLGEALDAVDDAMARSGPRHGQMWYLPELLRIKGEVLLQQGSDLSMLAEDCFNQAAGMAREQGALFWELRVALSLARLRVIQGRQNNARQILAPVYGRFTEGFGTADLRAAGAMLDTLPLV